MPQPQCLSYLAFRFELEITAVLPTGRGTGPPHGPPEPGRAAVTWKRPPWSSRLPGLVPLPWSYLLACFSASCCLFSLLGVGKLLLGQRLLSCPGPGWNYATQNVLFAELLPQLGIELKATGFQCCFLSLTPSAVCAAPVGPADSAFRQVECAVGASTGDAL